MLVVGLEDVPLGGGPGAGVLGEVDVGEAEFAEVATAFLLLKKDVIINCMRLIFLNPYHSNRDPALASLKNSGRCGRVHLARESEAGIELDSVVLNLHPIRNRHQCTVVH